jgi:hypothetical protein
MMITIAKPITADRLPKLNPASLKNRTSKSLAAEMIAIITAIKGNTPSRIGHYNGVMCRGMDYARPCDIEHFNHIKDICNITNARCEKVEAKKWNREAREWKRPQAVAA